MRPRAGFLTVALRRPREWRLRATQTGCSKAVDVHTDGHGAVADTPLDSPVEGFPTSFRVGGTEHMAVETRLGAGRPRQMPGVAVPAVHARRIGTVSTWACCRPEAFSGWHKAAFVQP